jgi:hypothetical protein
MARTQPLRDKMNYQPADGQLEDRVSQRSPESSGRQRAAAVRREEKWGRERNGATDAGRAAGR